MDLHFPLSFNQISYTLLNAFYTLFFNYYYYYSYRSKPSTHIKMNLVLLRILREVWLAFSSYSCTLALPVRYGALSGKIIIRNRQSLIYSERQTCGSC